MRNIAVVNDERNEKSEAQLVDMSRNLRKYNWPTTSNFIQKIFL